MATLVSSANGNFTAAIWKVADATSLLNTVAVNTATTTAYVASQTFIPGAITIDGFGVNLTSRIASPVGTFSVELYNSTDAVSVNAVTVNVSDIAAGGGWHVCSFSSITLLAGKSYSIRVKSSVTGEVTVYRNATAGNWARLLRTTTTATLAAGDNFIGAGQFTGAGAFTAYTVTMNNTSNTVFGTVSANAPACTINSKCSLIWENNAATNYKLRIAGGLTVRGTGVHTISAVGSPTPSTSTATLEFVISTNVDGGLEVWSGASFTAVGAQLRNVNRCFLNADAAATATTLTTDVATGWKAGDQIAIAPTGRTITQGETFILGVDASGTTVTLPSGLAYAHSGSAGRQAEIINLTRNVRIVGTSTSLCGYVYIKDGATFDCRQVEFTMLGSVTTGKKGVTFDTASTLANFEDCSFHDYFLTATTAVGLQMGVANAGVICKRGDFWNINYISIYMQFTPTSSSTLLDDNWMIGAGAVTSYGTLINSANINATNNRVSGSSISFNFAMANAAPVGTISGNVIHSCTNGPSITSVVNSEMTGFICWRTGGQGFSVATCVNLHLVIDESVGHVSSSLSVSQNKRCRIKVAVGKGEAGYTQPYSIYQAGMSVDTVIYDSVFGAAGAPGAAVNGDIVTTVQSADLIFQNCQFLSPVEFYVSTWAYGIGYRSEKHNGVAGNNKYVRWEGTMARDTTLYDAGGTASLRMTPTQTTVKMRSEPAWTTSVVSGGTATPSVRIRKSAIGDGTAYNGNQPRLMLSANPVAGITSDVVIATCSGAAGSWETVTGTTAAVTEDTRLEFYIDCDGTTGWINVDNFTVGSDDTSKIDVWANGTPYVIGALSLANFTDVDQDKIELGYAYKYNSSVNNRTGTRREAPANKVELGYAYGANDALIGTVRTADVTKTLLGYAYGPSDSLTGTRRDALVDNVLLGYAFGPGDSFVGTRRDASTNVVMLGVTYGPNDSLIGTVRLPVPSLTAHDYAYGPGDVLTGTYRAYDLWSAISDADVLFGTAMLQDGVVSTGRFVIVSSNKVLKDEPFGVDGLSVGTLMVITATTVTQLDDIWRRLGLDPAAPLVTTQTAVTAGALSMTLSGNDTASTLTRVP